MKILTDTGLMVLWQRIKDLYKKISVSAKQTTISTEDGGTNVMTFTFGDGTSTTLSVKNGSKGSDGAKGETGAKGEKGDRGDRGPVGETGAKGEKGDRGDRGPVGETGPQGNSGIADASNMALINDAVTGGETSYLSAEVGKLGILTYDCSKGGTVEHASLQDAINAVPTTFRKVGITIIYKSGDSIYRYALKSNSWSTDSTNWFSVEEKVSDLSKSIFVDNISDKSNFVKEVYLIGGDISKTYYISNISRNKKGYWWVEIKEKETGNRLGFTSKTEESPIITNTDSSNIKYYLFVNWNAIDVDTQVSVDIVLNNKAFDINNSPTIQGVLYSKYANDKLNDKLGDAIDISQYLIQQVYLKSNGETINGSWNVWYKIPVEKGDIITAKGITPDNINVSLASAVLYDSEGAPYLFTRARNAFEQEPIRKAGFVSIMANPEYQYEIKIVKNNSAGIATNIKIIENNNYIENIIPIASSYKDCILGYIDTNSTDGTSSLVVGNTVKVRESNSFKLIKTKVIKGDVIYVPYVDYNKFSNAYPIIVDLCNTVLYVYNTKGMETFNYKGVKYLKLKVAMSGYLIVSSNTEIIIYSENASLRNLEKEELSDNEKSVIRKYLGIEALAPIIPDIPLNYYDYEVACKMNPILLRNIIEMSSNGSCTVIYDNHKYPSLMYKIPLMSIGQLDSRLGDDNTPHPAFVVNGVIKKHIYAGVFMNTVYNDVPISWFGNRPLLTSKSFLESRNLCKGKGTGWHLETIWERSLISFLTALNHNTDKPTCNNDRGRSLVKHEQCVESRSTDNYLPGKFPNGGQWINGSQPIEWSHNNSRWGIFDIIGAFHEWCNLAKSDNGHIYLCEDNSYDKEESNWLDTGAYITSENNEIVYDTELKDIVTEHKIQSWASIKCNKSYDSISEDIRKKMALALMCPRLASTDEKSLHDFNGRIWIRSNLVCYPFIGGALEYNDSGLGFNILSYDGNEAHNNMGSRLFYIE